MPQHPLQMFLMRRETSSSDCWTIGSSFGSLSRAGRVDWPTVPLLPIVPDGLFEGGVVDWTEPAGGTWFGSSDGDAGSGGGGTLICPGLVMPGAVP